MKDVTPDSLSDAQLAPNMWRALAAAIPDVLLVVDRKGKILYINHTPAGITRPQALGTSALDYAPAAARDELQSSLERLFTTGVARCWGAGSGGAGVRSSVGIKPAIPSSVVTLLKPKEFSTTVTFCPRLSAKSAPKACAGPYL